jgi:hypothetical protein
MAQKPYFSRSLRRGSRVRNPAAFKAGRKAASTVNKARAMPWRTAPAWPLGPPPLTLIRMSYFAALSVTVSGATATVRRVSVGK